MDRNPKQQYLTRQPKEKVIADKMESRFAKDCELITFAELKAKLPPIKPITREFIVDFAKENRSGLEFAIEVTKSFQKRFSAIQDIIKDALLDGAYALDEWHDIVLKEPKTEQDINNIMQKIYFFLMSDKKEKIFEDDANRFTNSVLYLEKANTGLVRLGELSFGLPEVAAFLSDIKNALESVEMKPLIEQFFSAPNTQTDDLRKQLMELLLFRDHPELNNIVVAYLQRKDFTDLENFHDEYKTFDNVITGKFCTIIETLIKEIYKRDPIPNNLQQILNIIKSSD